MSIRSFILLFSLFCATVCGCSREAPRPKGSTTSNAIGSSKIDHSQARQRSSKLEWQIEYESSGRLKLFGCPNDTKTTFDYELNDRGSVRQIRAKRSDGSEIATEFDDFGRRIKMIDASGSVEYAYDSMGRPNRVQRSGAPAIAFSHGTSNQLLNIQVGDWQLKYGYDFLERVESIDSPKGKIRFEYEPGGHARTRVLPNGIKTTWNREPSGLLKSIVHSRPGGQPILQFEYVTMPGGTVKEVTELRWDSGSNSMLRHVYTYDQLNRLVHASQKGSRNHTEFRYEYDEVGNRIRYVVNKAKREAKFDWSGRLESLDGDVCLLDGASNLASYKCDNDLVKTTFNAAGLLSSVERRAEKVSYAYDGEGQMVTRKVGDVTESFLPNPFSDSWCPLLSKDAAGGETFYIWQGGTLLGTSSASGDTWFLENHLGSASAIINGDGSLLEFRDYEPFGSMQGQIKNKSLVPAFAGMFFDPCSGLYLTRARAYEPALGQWLQIDPLHRLPMVRQQDLGHFSYCGADPVNYVDPNGAAPQDWFEVQRRSTLTVPSIPLDTNRETAKFTWGTVTGEQSAKQWADKYVATGSWIALTAGLAASTWTPDTYQTTVFALTLPVSGSSTGVLKAVNFADKTMTTLDASVDLMAGRYRSGLGALSSEYGPDLIKFGTIAGAKALSNNNFHEAINNGSVGTVVKGLTLANTLQEGAAVALDTVSSAMDVRDLLHESFGDKNSKPSPIAEMRAALKALHVDRVGPTVFERQTSYEGGWTPLDRVVSSIAKEKAQEQKSSTGNGATNTSQSSVASSALSESNVGGIFLSGTQSLESFGELVGTYVDKESGTILLVSKNDRAASLPPFSLDEFATVLRCVYAGQPPSVSIDPDPNDPHGPKMLVRHGEGTEHTQVGQVLFEADRIMKGYSMGLDNLSNRPIETNIPGYAALFSGKPDLRYWSRFWIRPTKVTVRSDRDQPLSLFEVPLEVQTESMVMGKDGTLRPAPAGANSASAKKFSTWFTRNYEAISREARPELLRANGLTEPTPIFDELKRIALLTAAAEWMRDQGQPLPVWVKDYPFKPVKIAETTPAIQAAHERYSIYGGVSLSGRSEADFETRPLTAHDRELASEIKRVVKQLQTMVPAKIHLADGAQFNVTAIPSQSCTSPGACQLAESDLEIAVDGGRPLTLTRRYHSFFRPTGVLGEGWSLCLPHLEKQPVFESKQGQSVHFQIKMRLAQDFTASSDELKFYQNDERRVDAQAVMLLRDGEKFFFDKETGQLLGTHSGPDLTLYAWNTSQQLARIERWHGSQLRAHLQLTYDSQGRVQSAEASDGQSVHYDYVDGRLDTVRHSDSSVTTYRYLRGQISEVLREGRLKRKYDFKDNGQLRSLVTASGARTEFAFDSDESNQSNRSVVETQFPGVGWLKQTALRSGDLQEVLELLTGERHVFEHAPATHTWKLPTGAAYSLRPTPTGDTADLYMDHQHAMQIEYDTNGVLKKCRTEYAEFKPTVENGFLRELTVSGRTTKADRLRIQCNPLGQVTEIEQSSGPNHLPWKAKIDYDQSNRKATLRHGGCEINYNWDEQNRLTSSSSSTGGSLQLTYSDRTPAIHRMVVQDRGGKAAMERIDDHHVRLTRFDGGIVTASFENLSADSMRATLTLPNDLRIEHVTSSDGKSYHVTCDNRFRIDYEFDEKHRVRRIVQSPLQ